jgi:predicted DNA-binding protein
MEKMPEWLAERRTNITLSIPTWILVRLKERSKETGRPISEIVSEILEGYFRAEGSRR